MRVSRGLAGRLKKAGFPPARRSWRCVDVVYWRRPTLTELVEACGGEITLRHFRLTKKQVWRASKGMQGEFSERLDDAVAKLWLFLHRKAEP
jgi:hypothetical protein